MPKTVDPPHKPLAILFDRLRQILLFALSLSISLAITRQQLATHTNPQEG